MISGERDDLADKLFRLQLMLTDRENEIEKLNLVKNAYESKRSDLESFTEQVHYYKTQNDKLKAEIEVKDSKLNALEHADIQISKLREKVKEQNTKISKLKLEKIEFENSIKTMEKRLVMANEKIDLFKKRSSDMLEPNELVQETSYLSKLEEENGRLKRKVHYLIKELSEGDMDKLESDEIEKENQLLTGKVKGLLLHTKSLSLQNQISYQEMQKRSKDISDFIYKSPDKQHRDQKDKFNSTLQNMVSNSSLSDDKADPAESMNLLYTV